MSSNGEQSKTILTRILDFIEWAGNKLPDPAVLFVLALVLTWILSAALAETDFPDQNPKVQAKTMKKVREVMPNMVATTVGMKPSPLGTVNLNVPVVTAVATPQEEPTIQVKNQLTGDALLTFLENMVETFTGFHPLGVVLVAMLGVGVAEHTGFINACLKAMLGVTPKSFLTPMLLIVAIVSHTAGDTGYVLVIPLGGIIFATAGRHPVAGIVCAFAGVSGGFSANFIVSGLDPLLQGITQEAAQIIDPTREVNPLCNYFFMTASSLFIVAVGWFLTDRVIEPKLRNTPVDGEEATPNTSPTLEEPAQKETIPPDTSDKTDETQTLGKLSLAEQRGMIAGLIAAGFCLLGILALAYTGGTEIQERLIKAIVPLIFLVFLIPGIVHGYVSGTVKTHRDIIKGMSKSMSTMGYYLVMAFFAALFIYAFNQSNLGILLAVKGATFLKNLGLSPQITIVGIILLASLVNLLVGSASAKWALLGPIFVPMLMQIGISPELTQAAYRIGDSSTNIITPLMPYFPLIVVYAQRYVKSTGIGTLISLMLPYSVCFLFVWTVLLIIFWLLGLPLGVPIDVGYTYEPPF